MRWRASKRDYDNKPQPECKLCNKMTINLEWVPVFWGLGTISQNDFIVGAPWRYYIFKSCDFAPIFPLLWTLFVPFGFFLLCQLISGGWIKCEWYSTLLFPFILFSVSRLHSRTFRICFQNKYTICWNCEGFSSHFTTRRYTLYAVHRNTTNLCEQLFIRQTAGFEPTGSIRQRKMAQSKKNPANRKKRRLKWLRAGFSSGKRNS